MADYRQLRQRYSLLQICANPELAVAVTLQPVDLIEVDAAILFSDLLVPFTPMGLRFDFVKGEGPAVENPIRTAADVEQLQRFEPREALKHVLDTIRLLRAELNGRVPLIGFGGAPFTLAAYAIEGGPSTTYARTKAFMYAQPAAWHRLCSRFADMMADYLAAQVEAGVQAVQVFDSWAGALGRSDYREFALPHTSRIFSALKSSGVPLIHFAVNTAAIITDVAENGADVIGVDWRQNLDESWAVVGHDRGIQGNMDPALLLGPRERMFAASEEILRRAGGRPGHIFNLGHGVLPSTSLETVQALARHVHEVSRVP
ncbi:MAG: uroporphyrinogen decarboxylase [Acidobacteriota bacterium]